jgi:hypothetical protein
VKPHTNTAGAGFVVCSFVRSVHFSAWWTGGGIEKGKEQRCRDGEGEAERRRKEINK